MQRVAAAAVLLASGSAGAADFTLFETSILPQWLALFKRGATAGSYSYDQQHDNASVYGASDVVHIAYTTNQLNISTADAAAWAGVINSFQNSSGFYTPADYEGATGFQPWHATAYATSAVRLLGQQPTFTPLWAEAIAGGGEELWNTTFVPLLNDSSSPGANIWNRGHKIASIPAVLIMSGQGPASGAYADFWQWYFGPFLAGKVDPVTGTWCLRKEWAPPSDICLGGAFHIFFIYTAAAQPWLLPQTVMNMSMGLQKGTGTDAGLWGSVYPTFIDLDGVYQVVRPAAQLGQPPALWAQARASCSAYLSVAEGILNNATFVLEGPLAANTHNMAGTVAGIAECGKWFPDLVVTVRPWRQGLDVQPFV